MNDHDDNTPTEDDVADLLSTYADALYEQSVIPDGEQEQVQDNITGMAAGNSASEPVVASAPPPALDVDLRPEPSGSGAGNGRILALVGAAVLVVVMGIGAVAVLGNDDTSEVAAQQDAAEEGAPDETTAETTAEEGTAEEGTAEETTAEVSANDGAASETTTAVVDGSGAFSQFVSTTVFFEDDFVSLQSSDGGAITATFGVGDDATTVATTGLPDGVTWMPEIAPVNDGFVALIERRPDFDPANFDPFEVGPSPTFFLATSDDLVNWESAEITDFDLGESEGLFTNGLAVSGDQVVITGQIINYFGPEQLLFDAGLISEEELRNICSIEESGTSLTIYTCESDQANDDFAETEIVRLEEGDPLFDEVSALLEAQRGDPEVHMVVGPIGGPFETVDSPIAGFDTSIAGTPDGFLAVGVTTQVVTQAFSSTDGVTWTEVESPEGEDGFYGSATLAPRGDTIVTVTQGFETVTASSTTDLGQTWTAVDLPTALFGAYGEAVAGPAGFAIQLQGTTEPFENPFAEGDNLSLTKDGYTMTLNFISGGASLLDADGTIIHDDVFIDGVELENVVRFEGPFEENLIWLDPETGEDLITFTQDDFDEQFAELEPVDGDFVDPNLGSETWFSADGTNWTLLDSSDVSTNSFAGISAVGDDQVLTFSETYSEPPAELYEFEDGFVPTEEEVAALDAWYAEQGDPRTLRIIPVG